MWSRGGPKVLGGLGSKAPLILKTKDGTSRSVHRRDTDGSVVTPKCCC